MCGIAGYARSLRDGLALEGPDVLSAMTGELVHRGPDDHGYLLDERVALGHRRLSIIDRAGGAQPMTLAEHGISVCFNGEIYNYRQLNERLAGLGFCARTRSDTETLLLAYAAWGEGFLEHLQGMFAFVLYDRRRGVLLGARDRMGKKPLYYLQQGGLFAFASQPRAILRHPAASARLDISAAARFLLFEHVPAPQAIFQSMAKLGAGQCFTWRIDDGTLALREYWDLPSARASAAAPAASAGGVAIPTGAARQDVAAWGEPIRATLTQAVSDRLIADVPLGVFLSGGIDSAAVTAAMVRLCGPGQVHSFSIGFTDPRFDESVAAGELAGQLGTVHQQQIVDLAQVQEALPAVCALLDEPLADASILPTYLLARFTRQHVTVALSGDGGDELFAGYQTFRALPWARAYRALMPGLLHRRLALPLAGALPVGHGYFSLDFQLRQFLRGASAAENERLWRWLGAFAPEELADLLTPEALAQLQLPQLYEQIHELARRVAHCDAIERDAYLYAKTYLPEGVLVKVDRATMACSLEARAPLLDPRLVELAAAIPSALKVRGGQLKHVFRAALAPWLPASWLARPKRGFAPPMAGFLRGGLSGLLRETLSPARLGESGLFRPEKVARLIDDHLAGRRDLRKPLFTLLMFESWRQRWARG